MKFNGRDFSRQLAAVITILLVPITLGIAAGVILVVTR